MSMMSRNATLMFARYSLGNVLKAMSEKLPTAEYADIVENTFGSSLRTAQNTVILAEIIAIAPVLPFSGATFTQIVRFARPLVGRLQHDPDAQRILCSGYRRIVSATGVVIANEVADLTSIEMRCQDFLDRHKRLSELNNTVVPTINKREYDFESDERLTATIATASPFLSGEPYRRRGLKLFLFYFILFFSTVAPRTANAPSMMRENLSHQSSAGGDLRTAPLSSDEKQRRLIRAMRVQQHDLETKIKSFEYDLSLCKEDSWNFGYLNEGIKNGKAECMRITREIALALEKIEKPDEFEVFNTASLRRVIERHIAVDIESVDGGAVESVDGRADESVDGGADESVDEGTVGTTFASENASNNGDDADTVLAMSTLSLCDDADTVGTAFASADASDNGDDAVTVIEMSTLSLRDPPPPPKVPMKVPMKYIEVEDEDGMTFDAVPK